MLFMKEFHEKKKLFKNYTYAKCVLNVTFQPLFSPYFNFADVNTYLSLKNKFYS